MSLRLIPRSAWSGAEANDVVEFDEVFWGVVVDSEEFTVIEYSVEKSVYSVG